MRTATTVTTVLALALFLVAPPAAAGLLGGTLQAPTLDPLLVDHLAAAAPGTAVPAVITYRQMPGTAELDRLRSLGVDRGFVLQALPMAIVDLDAGQLAALRSEAGIASIWGNEVMQPLTNESRPFLGVPQMMADAEVTAANSANPGFPVSGRGVGIGYLDTGIDATRPDLEFGSKVVENVNQPLAYGVVSDGGLLLGVGVSISDLLASTGFVPPIYLEGQPSTDLESGHGTHGAGVAAGSGESSGGFYGGVAPGAHLVGVSVGTDMGLPLVAILGGFDYLLVHQFEHSIRVINNSWGRACRRRGCRPTTRSTSPPASPMTPAWWWSSPPATPATRRERSTPIRPWRGPSRSPPGSRTASARRPASPRAARTTAPAPTSPACRPTPWRRPTCAPTSPPRVWR
jgi:serine protease AprX